jgi:hypothetical protein
MHGANIMSGQRNCRRFWKVLNFLRATGGWRISTILTMGDAARSPQTQGSCGGHRSKESIEDSAFANILSKTMQVLGSSSVGSTVLKTSAEPLRPAPLTSQHQPGRSATARPAVALLPATLTIGHARDAGSKSPSTPNRGEKPTCFTPAPLLSSFLLCKREGSLNYSLRSCVNLMKIQVTLWKTITR